MRETPTLSTKTWKGSRTLRFMETTRMFELGWRFRPYLRLQPGCALGQQPVGILQSGLRNDRFRFSQGCRRDGFSFSLRFVNRPNHVERAFRIVFEFIAQDALTSIQRVLEADELSFEAD